MSSDTQPHSIHWQRLATGIAGSEGPLVTRDGRIFLVEPPTGSILEICDTDSKSVFATTGGMPAGLQLHRDGSIWVADMKLGILRVTLEGGVEHLVGRFEGAPIRGCNDCSFDSLGNLYFTAPSGSSRDNPCGEIFCRLHSGEVLRMDGGFAFCNGIAISADDTVLIVAETFTKQLHRYRLSEPGKSTERDLFATLPGDHNGGPDGIEFDAEGNLIATNWAAGHLEVFSPEGLLIRRISLPFDKPSNLHFAGPGSADILVTEHTTNSLWQGTWHCPGQRQFGWLQDHTKP
ncbi:MAG: SMP-30/gluconolactonase/LRE family protein [Verrucomicrobiota bacterium]